MSNLREVLVELAERAFRRRPPFEIIEKLGLPSPIESLLFFWEQGAAARIQELAHQLDILQLRGEMRSAAAEEMGKRLDELLTTGRLETPRKQQLRRDQDRKGCLRVLRRIKRELMASGWKRLKGGRFQRDIEGFFIQLWFDPGTYRAFLDIFLAAGPPWISVIPGKFFDIEMEKVLYMGPPEEFEKNLRKILTVVKRFEEGLRELLTQPAPESSPSEETNPPESEGAAAAESGDSGDAEG